MRQSGFSFIELLVAMGLIGMVIAAVAFFVAETFDLPAWQLEQGSITTTARVQMERMSDEIRDSSLGAGAPNDITVDGVRYWLDGTNLMRNDKIAARGIRNGAVGQDMFRYFSIGGPKALELDPRLPSYGPLARVEITLVVDIDEGQLPEAALIQTVVTLR